MSVYYKENPEWFDQSILSVLNNTLIPDEIVIVKDGLLTNELENIISKYKGNPKFQIVGYEDNRGLGKALNFGIEHCHNELIARMDTDDISMADRFAKQINCFKQNPNIAIVGSNITEFFENPDNEIAVKVVPENNNEIRKYIKKRSPFNHPSVMFKKSAVINVGSYIDLFRLEDYYLWYRLIKNNYNGYNIQESLLKMRTPSDFYKRRGGFKAFKSRMTINKIMLSDSYINFFEFLYVFFINFINAIMPNFIRSLVFKKILRK